MDRCPRSCDSCSDPFPKPYTELGQFRLTEGDALRPKDIFQSGQKVDVTGVSHGKGFAGVIKRHHFSSNRASHGNSVSHNKPGSISMAQDPGRVFPGKKMPGHLGAVKRTVQNLEIVRVDVERQLLLIRGAVPGSRGGDLMVSPAKRAQRVGAKPGVTAAKAAAKPAGKAGAK